MEGQDFHREHAGAHGEPDVFEIFDEPARAGTPFIRLISSATLRLKAAGHVLRTGEIPDFPPDATPYVTRKAGAKHTNLFTLPPSLREKFRLVPQLDSEVRTILHIATASQQHKPLDIEAIITREKDIEALLIYLVGQYDLRTVYAEGIKADTLDILARTRAAIHERRQRADATVANVSAYINEIARAAEHAAYADQATRAAVLYLLKLEITTELDNLLTMRAAAERGEKIPRELVRYAHELKKSHEDFNHLVERVRDEVSAMAEQPLLKDDLVYLYGATLKLFVEGRITLHPAETVETKTPARAAKNPLSPGGEEDREDTALSLVRNDLTRNRERFIPLIYGRQHDFKNNIQLINHILDEPFGLLRLEYRESP